MADQRPPANECSELHVVTSGHVISCHTIRSSISKNPMLHANLMTLCFVEPELWPIKVSHCGNGHFLPFSRLSP